MGACAASGAAAAEATRPERIPGLVARYDVASLHRHTRDGEAVERWTDSSRNGHHLTAVWEDAPPRFETLALNGRPVVALGPGNRYDVAHPFELEDHTILLVYGTEYTERALFSDDADPRRGVVLAEDGRTHDYQNGKQGRVPYSRPRELGLDYGITVLGRQAGALKAFVNGAEVSSGLELEDPIRVGRFFTIRHTTFVTSDAEGLRVAEMIFYDRYLTESERDGLTRHLSEEYGIALEQEVEVRTVAAPEDDAAPIDDAAVLLRLETRKALDLEDEAVLIGWSPAGRVEAPFHVDAGTADTQVHCTRHGTRVRVHAVLELRSDVVGPRVRLLLLKNGRDYHPVEAATGPFDGEGDEKRAKVALRTEVTLDAGDFLEVVAIRSGPPGRVWLEPGGGLLVVERIR